MAGTPNSNHIKPDANFNAALQTLNNRLAEQPVSILCGAGISYNSGLPVVHQFLEEIFTRFELPGEEKAILHSTEFPFEAFIEMLQKECETDELLKIFRDGKYNTNHLFIAYLIKNKKVKNIVTTNFDELIEQACKAIGLEEPKDYRVYRTESEFEEINWSCGIPNLIKIHGCSSDLKSMAINMRMVANQTDSINKISVVRNLFNRELNPVVLIVGYSCSDVFDISPVIERIVKDESEVMLLEHVDNPENYRIEHLTKQQHKNPFLSFRNGKRLFFPADMFIEGLWRTLGLPEYSFVKRAETNWRANIDRWYNFVVDANSRAFKHHMCARVFYSSG